MVAAGDAKELSAHAKKLSEHAKKPLVDCQEPHGTPLSTEFGCSHDHQSQSLRTTRVQRRLRVIIMSRILVPKRVGSVFRANHIY